MPTVEVRRLSTRDEIGARECQQIDDIENRIRQAAQRLFEARAGLPGNPDEDWVRAERETCWAPQVELKESDGALRLIMGIPGLNAEDIQVTLLPEMVIIRGNGLQDATAPQRVHFSEFGSGTLFRQVPLPVPVHVESAVVAFEMHLLKISAAMAEPAENFNTALASA